MRLHKWVLVAVLAVGAGCNQMPGQKKAEEEPAKEKAAASTEEVVVIPVETQQPHRGSISLYFETTSRVEAEKRVQVVAEAIGACQSVHCEEGDFVEAGKVLAQLDARDVLATIGQTEVQVRQTKTQLDIAERSLAEGIGAQAERDNARFAHDQALASLNMHKVQLEKMTVRAPISGLVTKRNVQVGQLVASGAALFQLVDPASYILVINPPEKELGRLAVGQVAKVTVDALGDAEFDARVRRINPGVDSATGTVKVLLEFDEGTRRELRESAFARVRLVLDTHENALLVPKDALIEENARRYLFTVEEDVVVETAEEGPPAAETAPVVAASVGGAAGAPVAPADGDAAAGGGDGAGKDGKPRLVAKRVEVETGLEDSTHIEILTGLVDGAQVVTLGQHTLKPGTCVTVTNADAEISSSLGMDASKALEIGKARSENLEPGQPNMKRRPRR